MIWIECDCCGKTLPRHGACFEVSVRRYGTDTIPMHGKSHYCEECFMKLRRAAEVVKHDA